jgi:hypothetical protein
MKIKCYGDFEKFVNDALSEIENGMCKKGTLSHLVEQKWDYRLYKFGRFFVEFIFCKSSIHFEMFSSYENRVQVDGGENISLYGYYGGDRSIAIGQPKSVKSMIAQALSLLNA